MHTKLVCYLKKDIFPQFNVQIMTKKRSISPFKDILAAILKGALYVRNLQNFENMPGNIASYWLKYIYIFGKWKLPIFLLLAGNS